MEKWEINAFKFNAFWIFFKDSYSFTLFTVKMSAFSSLIIFAYSCLSWREHTILFSFFFGLILAFFSDIWVTGLILCVESIQMIWESRDSEWIQNVSELNQPTRRREGWWFISKNPNLWNPNLWNFFWFFFLPPNLWNFFRKFSAFFSFIISFILYCCWCYYYWYILKRLLSY